MVEAEREGESEGKETKEGHCMGKRGRFKKEERH
jgi:hypothetical protein